MNHERGHESEYENEMEIYNSIKEKHLHDVDWNDFESSEDEFTYYDDEDDIGEI